MKRENANRLAAIMESILAAILTLTSKEENSANQPTPTSRTRCDSLARANPLLLLLLPSCLLCVPHSLSKIIAQIIAPKVHAAKNSFLGLLMLPSPVSLAGASSTTRAVRALSAFQWKAQCLQSDLAEAMDPWSLLASYLEEVAQWWNKGIRRRC